MDYNRSKKHLQWRNELRIILGPWLMGRTLTDNRLAHWPTIIAVNWSKSCQKQSN